MKVITISGKAESGKDTTANILKICLENKGYSVLICHYADLLKFICKEYFDWDGMKNEEGRSLLQRVGTEGIRKVEPNYWVDFIKSMLKFFPEEWDYVLIPDTRFPNEIELMKNDFDVTTINVVRPDYENGLTEEQRQHPSETALDNYKFDHVLKNPGNLGDYIDVVKKFVKNMFESEEPQTLMNKIKETF